MPRWVPVFMASAAAKTSVYIWSELHLINILISVLSHLPGEKINSVNLCYAKAWEANILFANCLCSRQQSSGSWHERLKWLARAQFSRYSHADWHQRRGGIYEDEDVGGSLLLRMRWCRCTSSSRDTCWPGTSGRFCTAASSSGPSCRRCRRCRSPSPGFKQRGRNYTHRQTSSNTLKFTSSIQLIKCGLWRSTADDGPLKNIVQQLVVCLNRFFISYLLHVLTRVSLKNLSSTSDSYPYTECVNVWISIFMLPYTFAPVSSKLFDDLTCCL